LQRCWPWSVATSAHRATLAWCYRASQVATRSLLYRCHSAEPSPSVSDRPMRASLFTASRFVSVCALPWAINSSCRATGSAPMAVGRSLFWNSLPDDLRDSAWTRRERFQTICWRSYFYCTSAFSALEVVTRMRYINSHLTLTLLVAIKAG